MVTYEVYFHSYASGENVTPDAPLRLSAQEAAVLMDRQLVTNGDFVGLIDHAGDTFQFMRGNADRVWAEVIAAAEKGAYGSHMPLEEARQLVENLDAPVASLKPGFTFVSWDGTVGRFPLAIPADQIRRLITGDAMGVATDYVMRGDRGVGYLRRDESSFDGDSGWRFFAGTETAQYLEEPSVTAAYELNTIANYEPAIVPLFDAPIGSAFRRANDGDYRAEQP